MRADAVGALTITDPAAYEQCTQLARGVADVLRRNVVQAVKVTGSADESAGQEDRWSKLDFSGENNFLTVCFRVANNKGYRAGVKRDDKKISLRGTIQQESAEKGEEQQVRRHFISFCLPLNTRLTFSFAPDAAPSLPSFNLPALRKAHKYRTLPDLREEDLVESFVRGMSLQR
jgi:hypothetical protein